MPKHSSGSNGRLRLYSNRALSRKTPLLGGAKAPQPKTCGNSAHFNQKPINFLHL
jgi:hypothetical protein